MYVHPFLFSSKHFALSCHIFSIFSYSDAICPHYSAAIWSYRNLCGYCFSVEKLKIVFVPLRINSFFKSEKQKYRQDIQFYLNSLLLPSSNIASWHWLMTWTFEFKCLSNEYGCVHSSAVWAPWWGYACVTLMRFLFSQGLPFVIKIDNIYSVHRCGYIHLKTTFVSPHSRQQNQ